MKASQELVQQIFWTSSILDMPLSSCSCSLYREKVRTAYIYNRPASVVWSYHVPHQKCARIHRPLPATTGQNRTTTEVIANCNSDKFKGRRKALYSVLCDCAREMWPCKKGRESSSAFQLQDSALGPHSWVGLARWERKEEYFRLLCFHVSET